MGVLVTLITKRERMTKRTDIVTRFQRDNRLGISFSFIFTERRYR